MIDGNAKVLIADDFELVRIMLSRVLNELGLSKVDQATHGEQALQMLEDAVANNEPYDIVFLDWNMPKMDGYTVLQKCRDQDALKNVPIIMVTAESERPYVLKALTAGATDYVIKPFSSEMLKEKIKLINNRLQAAA